MKKKLAGIVLLCIMLVGASGVCAGVDYLQLGFDSMKNEERLELVERFARNLASGEVR